MTVPTPTVENGVIKIRIKTRKGDFGSLGLTIMGNGGILFTGTIVAP